VSKALWAGIVAFSCWGLFPIYWKWFHELDGLELFSHRLLWSFVSLWIWIFFKHRSFTIKALWLGPKRYWLMLSALLISSNWLLYIYAVTNHKILEASMGYFLNPLINVMFGWLFLGEHLRKTQWPAIFAAMIGVSLMAFSVGLSEFPWIALTLSITFAFYGLIRKTHPVGSMEGLTYETTVIFLPFIIFWLAKLGSPLHALEILGWGKYLALAASGIVTCIPLILFTYAAKNLKLQTLGITQYLSPSLKFACGWALFHEPISQGRWIAFVFIWLGLVWYTLESIRYSKPTEI
jgi:chloramphenicol-sensitive protein RarD